jgi:hypothetical protein
MYVATKPLEVGSVLPLDVARVTDAMNCVVPNPSKS